MNVIEAFETANLSAVPMHSHDCWELVIYTSGTCRTQVGDKIFLAKKGNAVIIPPNTPHSETCDAPYKALCITANHMPFGENTPIMSADYTSNIYSLGKMIFSTLIEKNKNYANLADALLSSVFECIIQLSQTFGYPQLVHDIEHFLIKNLSNPLMDMNLLCENFGYNKDYLRRFFKQYTSKTPLEHLNFLRISHAKQLLSANVYRVGEIALICGFSDAYYFSRAFKKFTGFSPVHYRKISENS